MGFNPSTAADRWATNLGGAGEKIREGVNNVSEAPTAKAAKAVDRYLAGVQKAVSDGSYVAGLNRVSLQDWKDAMLNKGITRVTSGATVAKPKMREFLAEVQPHIEQGQRMLESMPKGTLDQSKARAIAWIDHMAKFKKNRSSAA